MMACPGIWLHYTVPGLPRFSRNLGARSSYSITIALWMHAKIAPCAWFQVLLSAWEIPRCPFTRPQQPLNAWIAETRKFYPWSFPSRVLWYSPCSATSFSTELTFLDIEVFYGKSLALKKMFLFFRYFFNCTNDFNSCNHSLCICFVYSHFKGTHNTHFFKMFFHLFLSLSLSLIVKLAKSNKQ